MGRFITKDPARDLRGDGDLYDYCVDDPIGRLDRDGRYWGALQPILQGIAGAFGAVGLGVGVPMAVEKGVKVANKDNIEDSSYEENTVAKIAPLVTAAALTPKAVIAAGVGGTKALSAGIEYFPIIKKAASSMIDKVTSSASNAVDKVVYAPPLLPITTRPEIVEGVRDSVQSLLDPNPSMPTTKMGGVTTYVKQGLDYLTRDDKKDFQEKNKIQSPFVTKEIKPKTSIFEKKRNTSIKFR